MSASVSSPDRVSRQPVLLLALSSFEPSSESVDAIDSWIVSPAVSGYSSLWMSSVNLRSSRSPKTRATRSYFFWSMAVMVKVESRRSESAL